MLPPHELKNKSFSHVLRGYSSAEVDDYIEFLLERYADIYRRNDQLEKELRIANARLEELTAKEDAINRALVNAQRLEEKIINDANDQADIITRAAKTNADRILNDFHRKVGKERETLHSLRSQVAVFKKEVLAQYTAHIAAIELVAPDLEGEPEWETTEEEYVAQVLGGIRQAAIDAAEISEKKNKLDEIMQAHTVETAEEPVTAEKPKEKADPYIPPVENKVEVSEPADEIKEVEPVIVEKKPALKRRPRARRTVENLGAVQPVQQPIPASPGEENNSDTEDALDRLFSDSVN